jgi:hypothetical protein
MMRRQILIAAAISGISSTSAMAGTFATMNIDGAFGDWTTIPVTSPDPAGDGNPIDIADISVANDNDYLYLKITYHTAVNPNIGPEAMYLALDTDQNVGTGYNIFGLNLVGSEAGFQADFPFDQRTSFNSGGLTAAALLAPVDFGNPANVFTTQEMSIPRNVKFASDNAPVFSGNSFNLMFYSFPAAMNDVTSVISYTFATAAVGWSNPSSGNWNLASNWSYGSVPNGVGALAQLGNVISGPETIYSNTAITVGTLAIDSPNMYVIAGAGTLTIESASTAAIDVLQGSHKVNLPTIFQSNANVSVATGATLTLADPVTIKANKTVTKSGTVVISAPLTLESGAVLNSMSGPLSVYSAPSLAGGAKITAASLDVDYRGIASPAGTVRQQLQSGYAGGAWNGSGINTASAVAGQIGLGWVDDTANQNVKVRLARYGDANLSGTVDSADFNAFVGGYGNSASGVWASGDFNYDQKVSTLDFNLLAGNFGQSVPAASQGSVVPEPASLSMLTIGAVLALRRRCRQ